MTVSLKTDHVYAVIITAKLHNLSHVYVIEKYRMGLLASSWDAQSLNIWGGYFFISIVAWSVEWLDGCLIVIYKVIRII